MLKAYALACGDLIGEQAAGVNPPDDEAVTVSNRKFEHYELVIVGIGSLNAVRRLCLEVRLPVEHLGSGSCGQAQD